MKTTLQKVIKKYEDKIKDFEFDIKTMEAIKGNLSTSGTVNLNITISRMRAKRQNLVTFLLELRGTS